jgi:hypothetical protein
VTEHPTSTKRQVNQLMREGLRKRAESEQIAFFCECADSGCYQAVWLTGAEYDRARADAEWAALVPGHRAAAAAAPESVAV